MCPTVGWYYKRFIFIIAWLIFWAVFEGCLDFKSQLICSAWSCFRDLGAVVIKLILLWENFCISTWIIRKCGCNCLETQIQRCYEMVCLIKVNICGIFSRAKRYCCAPPILWNLHLSLITLTCEICHQFPWLNLLIKNRI